MAKAEGTKGRRNPSKPSPTKPPPKKEPSKPSSGQSQQQ